MKKLDSFSGKTQSVKSSAESRIAELRQIAIKSPGSNDYGVKLLNDGRLCIDIWGEAAIAGTLNCTEVIGKFSDKTDAYHVLAGDLVLSGLSYGLFFGRNNELAPQYWSVQEAFENKKVLPDGVAIVESRPFSGDVCALGKIHPYVDEDPEDDKAWSMIEVSIGEETAYLSLFRTYRFQVSGNLSGQGDWGSTPNIGRLPDVINCVTNVDKTLAHRLIKSQALLAMAIAGFDPAHIGGSEEKLDEWIKFCFEV